MKGLQSVLLLLAANLFMTIAWYAHLRFKDSKLLQHSGLMTTILIAWGIAFFEYCLQVPANRIGYQANGGPFSLFELKIIQEVITLTVFTIFALLVFRNETLRWNHLAAFACLLAAIVFVFKK